MRHYWATVSVEILAFLNIITDAKEILRQDVNTSSIISNIISIVLSLIVIVYLTNKLISEK